MHMLRRLVLQLPARTRRFTVLALESSADDTCAAVVTSDRKILSNIVVKQLNLHESTGGIYPPTAIDAHQMKMPGAVRMALEQAGLDMHSIDGIAFTRGPGIGGCLSVCSNAAKSLAAALNKPIVGVHHMQAHALTPILTSKIEDTPSFPFLTLLVSGGHTLLLLATSTSEFKILATTVDESVGRVFDKVSRALQLKWNDVGAGAALENFCAEKDDSDESMQKFDFPRTMPKKLAFSYSSLHSTVDRILLSYGGVENMSPSMRRALARAFQRAAFAQIEEKVCLAWDWCEIRGIQPKNLVVSGGVASNMFLRQRLQESLERHCDEPPVLNFPPPSLCTDNAAMIAWASMHRFIAGDTDPYEMDLRPKWNIENISPIRTPDH